MKMPELEVARNKILAYTGDLASEKLIMEFVRRNEKDHRFNCVDKNVSEVLKIIKGNGEEIKILIACVGFAEDKTKLSWQDGLKIAEKAKMAKIPHIAIVSDTFPQESERLTVNSLDIKTFCSIFEKACDEFSDWVLRNISDEKNRPKNQLAF